MGARFRLDRPTARARALRNDPTVHEELLWGQLKRSRLMGLKFSRQIPVAGFHPDFVCRSHRFVIELDGSQHADNVKYDDNRTRMIEAAGYRVIRFWNNDLNSNMAGVLEAIIDAAGLSGRAPTPQPRPASGRGRRKT